MAFDWSDTSTVGKINCDSNSVIALTFLNQKVYVIHGNSSHIQVYDSVTLNWVSEFKLEDVDEPNELTACAVNNLLYLACRKDQTVYKAESNGSKVLLKWKTDEDSYNLSTTKKGNVIMAGLMKRALKEHTQHGILLRTIILKSDVGVDMNPWIALELESGNYLICHGESRARKHRVCVITSNGDVLKSFGNEKGSGVDRLFGPYHLVVDEIGNILVADCNNHRIVVLSPNLQYLTEIKADLRLPVKLCIDSTTGTLYVADNEFQGAKQANGQIVVFKIKH